MMEIREIRELLAKLGDNDGLTLKGFSPVTYKSGYQVAVEGLELVTVEEAAAAVINYNGSCGVWYSAGIYYIDRSIRVGTLTAALALGRACHQISILKWHDMSLIYC